MRFLVVSSAARFCAHVVPPLELSDEPVLMWAKRFWSSDNWFCCGEDELSLCLGSVLVLLGGSCGGDVRPIPSPGTDTPARPSRSIVPWLSNGSAED